MYQRQLAKSYYNSLFVSGKKVSVKFEDGYTHIDSNGQYPDIGMNNRGWLIQIYHKETVVNLRLRYKIGHLGKDNKITWSNHYSLLDKGYYPRVALNDQGVVVTVYASQVGRQIYCRVGKLHVDVPEITPSVSSATPSEPSSAPSTPHQNDLPQPTDSKQKGEGDEETSINAGMINGATIDWKEEFLLGEGRNPSVSLSNNNTVVIVYEKGQLFVKTYYRIGDIIRDRTITWRNDKDPDDLPLLPSGHSKHASVAINDRGEVVVGYSSAVERAVHFASGYISSNNNSIILSEEKLTPLGVNYQPVVSLSNQGHVVAVHHNLQGRLYLKMGYGLLTVDDITGQSGVEWQESGPEDFAHDAHYASVAVSDRGTLVTAYKHLTVKFKKSIRNKVGRFVC